MADDYSSRCECTLGAVAESIGVEGSLLMHPLVLCALVAAAFWDSWRWYWVRVSAAPEEALSLGLAVAFLFVLALPRLMSGFRLHSVPLTPIVVLLLTYAAATFFLPPIMCAALAVLTVLLVLYLAVFGRRPPLGFYGLIALALPVLPSLQFVLGYPMRLVAATMTVGVLNLQGVHVVRQGTYVIQKGEMSQFDAPCSGVTALWALLLLAFMISTVRHATFAATAKAVFCAACLAILANVLRVSCLLHLNVIFTSDVSASLHEMIGVVSCALAAGGLLWVLTPRQSREAAA